MQTEILFRSLDGLTLRETVNVQSKDIFIFRKCGNSSVRKYRATGELSVEGTRIFEEVETPTSYQDILIFANGEYAHQLNQIKQLICKIDYNTSIPYIEIQFINDNKQVLCKYITLDEQDNDSTQDTLKSEQSKVDELTAQLYVTSQEAFSTQLPTKTENYNGLTIYPK